MAGVEIWKIIKGYEDYSVSNFGNVKRNTGKNLTYKIGKNEYASVSLYSNGVSKTHSVHRLVADYFVCKTDANFNYVNHKDGNKINNHYKNLEWCTQSHNIKEAFRIGLAKPTPGVKGKDNDKSKSVLQLSMNGELIKKWNFLSEVESEGFSMGCVSMVCTGKRKHHKGYKWSFE